MIYRQAYDTTMGAAVSNIRSVRDAVSIAIINDNLYFSDFNEYESNGETLPILITGSTPKQADIPNFVHAIFGANRNLNWVVMDVRRFVNVDKDGKVTVRSSSDFLLAEARMLMSAAWMKEDISDIKNNLTFAGEIYGAWLSHSISSKFGLDPKDQASLNCLAQYFYMTLFEDLLAEDFKERAVLKINNNMRVGPKFVFDLIENLPELRTINDFCEAVKNSLDNVRLKDFNLALLLTCISNSWFGVNAKEMMSVALEHPPTWICIVYAALTDRSFRKSMIATTVLNKNKQGKGDTYLFNFATLTRGYKRV